MVAVVVEHRMAVVVEHRMAVVVVHLDLWTEAVAAFLACLDFLDRMACWAVAVDDFHRS